jgi:hypothetical protein
MYSSYVVTGKEVVKSMGEEGRSRARRGERES